MQILHLLVVVAVEAAEAWGYQTLVQEFRVVEEELEIQVEVMVAVEEEQMVGDQTAMVEMVTLEQMVAEVAVAEDHSMLTGGESQLLVVETVDLEEMEDR